MEILTYVLEGAVEHQDSMGNKEQVPAGEFQIMSAGTGVRHSEYNPSKTDRLRLRIRSGLFRKKPALPCATSSAASTPPRANSWCCRRMREMAR